MTTTVPTPDAATVATILRVAAQMTGAQVDRLATAQMAVPAHAFAGALVAARCAAPAAATKVDEDLDVLVDEAAHAHLSWVEDTDARMREVAANHPTATMWGEVGLAVVLVGAPVLTITAALRLVPWGVPLTCLLGGLSILAGAAVVLGEHLNTHARARAVRLDAAWQAVEGAALAVAAAHTIGRPDGLGMEEYEALTGPWARQVLPLPPVR